MRQEKRDGIENGKFDVVDDVGIVDAGPVLLAT